ncbi:AraC family transcriptional regulator [Fictibacillus sp. B-59209]
MERRPLEHPKQEIQKCGMEDAAYFSKLFKKLEGISPRAYRRMSNLF